MKTYYLNTTSNPANKEVKTMKTYNFKPSNPTSIYMKTMTRLSQYLKEVKNISTLKELEDAANKCVSLMCAEYTAITGEELNMTIKYNWDDNELTLDKYADVFYTVEKARSRVLVEFEMSE